MDVISMRLFSNCRMRRNVHFIVPSSRFQLASGSSEALSTYTFGTHTAKHHFCKHCGITSFYIPRSNPDGVAVSAFCVDPATVDEVRIEQFNGMAWEEEIGKSQLSARSKIE